MKFTSATIAASALLATSIATEAPVNITGTANISRSLASQTDCSTVIPEVDLPGYDVGSVKDSRIHWCHVYCWQNQDCHAWTWSDHEGGTCWLKSGYSRAVTKIGAASGVLYPCDKPAAEQYLVIDDCDMPGNDRDSHPGASYADCKTDGKATFTWSDYNGGTCWYKTVRGVSCVYAPNKYTGVTFAQ